MYELHLSFPKIQETYNGNGRGGIWHSTSFMVSISPQINKICHTLEPTKEIPSKIALLLHFR